MGTSPNPPAPARPKRFALELPIEFRAQDEDRWWPGTTKNISANGVLFSAHKHVPPQTAIEITLQLPAALTGDSVVRLLCLGHVVRSVEPRSRTDETQVAATFVDYRLANGKAGALPELRQAQLLASRGDIARLAHRINSLLSIIMGDAELILMDPSNETKVRLCCVRTRQATQEAATLVSSLVTILASVSTTSDRET